MIQPLEFTTNVRYAVLPAVCARIEGEMRIAVVNPNPKLIEILTGFPVASVKPVAQSPPDSQIAEIAPRLPGNAKLRKIVAELQIDVIPNSDSQKQLLALISKYLDVFSECESDVGPTDLAFHKIDTATCARCDSQCVGFLTSRCTQQSNTKLEN